MSNLVEQLDVATARIDQVIWLQGSCMDSTLAATLSDLLDEIEEETLWRCFPDMPREIRSQILRGAKATTKELFAEWVLERKLGFLILVETPVMEHFEFGSRYRWGRRRCAWMYGDTFDLAVHAGLTWVAAIREIEKRKAKGLEQTNAQPQSKDL